jgi:hypothetical protein
MRRKRPKLEQWVIVLVGSRVLSQNLQLTYKQFTNQELSQSSVVGLDFLFDQRSICKAGLFMPLQKQLIALTPKKLISCRECQAIADVSMNGSNVKLMCPSCYHTLGSWETKAEALADITAFCLVVRAQPIGQ